MSVLCVSNSRSTQHRWSHVIPFCTNVRANRGPGTQVALPYCGNGPFSVVDEGNGSGNVLQHCLPHRLPQGRAFTRGSFRWQRGVTTPGWFEGPCGADRLGRSPCIGLTGSLVSTFRAAPLSPVEIEPAGFPRAGPGPPWCAVSGRGFASRQADRPCGAQASADTRPDGCRVRS